MFPSLPLLFPKSSNINSLAYSIYTCFLIMLAYRAPSLLQPHRARQALKDSHDGKIAPLVGYWHAVSAPSVVRITAQLGFDVLCLDWEHSSVNVETLTQASEQKMISLSMTNSLQMVHDAQLISEGKTMALVRYFQTNPAFMGTY